MSAKTIVPRLLGEYRRPQLAHDVVRRPFREPKP